MAYNDELGYIDVVFVGNTTGRDLREATTRGIALAKELGVFNFLADATELEIAAGVMDIYDLPDKQYQAEDMERASRVALVMPKSPEAIEAARFYETACVNRGWRVTLFPTRDEALFWLTGTKRKGSRE